MPTKPPEMIKLIIPGLPGYIRGFGPVFVFETRLGSGEFKWRCIDTPFHWPHWKTYVTPYKARHAAHKLLLEDFLRAYGSGFKARMQGMCDDIMLDDIEILRLEAELRARREARIQSMAHEAFEAMKLATSRKLTLDPQALLDAETRRAHIQQAQEPAPILAKRKRGRPRKHPLPVETNL